MNISGSIFATLADILGLSVFSGLRETMLLGAFKNLIESISEEKTQDAVFFAQSNATLDLVEKWAAFMEAFVEEQRGYSFYLTLACMTALDENAYTLAAETGPPAGPPAAFPPVLAAMAKTDLSRLGRIASFDIPGLGFYIAETCRKAGLDLIAGNIEEESRVLWAAEGKKAGVEAADKILAIFPENTNWGQSLPALTAHIRERGAGLLGHFASFRWEWGDASLDMPPLSPVKNPDPVQIACLAGYEEQRSVVIANTLRFLEGRPASNLLLYGDRGTGKSATVKAVCAEYAARGLRLLEVRKGDLCHLPAIMDFLGSRGRPFVIFIDDLSFEDPEDPFTGPEALPEGELETRPPNVVIYAASNRRHPVKEGPPGEGPRPFDATAGGFGITVAFTAPDQETYLKIAEHIARRRGLLADAAPGGPEWERFRENALRWERWFKGRTPRAAVRYVDWIAGGGATGAFNGKGVV
jgi:predicted AAA+ superfamily ATPase